MYSLLAFILIYFKCINLTAKLITEQTSHCVEAKIIFLAYQQILTIPKNCSYKIYRP